MVELTDIDGVGPSYADSLADAGMESSADVAEADVDEIGEALGPAANPEQIHEHAVELSDVERDNEGDEEETDDVETQDDQMEDDAAEEMKGPSDPRGGVVEYEVDDRETAYYLVKGLVDENLRLKQRNEYHEVDQVNDLIDRLMSNIDEDGGSVLVDLDDLSVLYTAVRNVEQSFQRTRGITDLVGQMKDAREDIQHLRSGLWPDSA